MQFVNHLHRFLPSIKCWRAPSDGFVLNEQFRVASSGIAKCPSRIQFKIAWIWKHRFVRCVLNTFRQCIPSHTPMISFDPWLHACGMHELNSDIYSLWLSNHSLTTGNIAQYFISCMLRFDASAESTNDASLKNYCRRILPMSWLIVSMNGIGASVNCAPNSHFAGFRCMIITVLP